MKAIKSPLFHVTRQVQIPYIFSKIKSNENQISNFILSNRFRLKSIKNNSFLKIKNISNTKKEESELFYFVFYESLQQSNPRPDFCSIKISVGNSKVV